MTAPDEARALAAECAGPIPVIEAYTGERVDYDGVRDTLDLAAAALRDLADRLAAAETDAAAARERVRELEAERRALDGETFAGVALISGGLLRLTIVWDGVSKAPVWFGSGPMLCLTEDERDAVKRLRAALGEGGE